jgi:hypothetical protein
MMPSLRTNPTALTAAPHPSLSLIDATNQVV